MTEPLHLRPATAEDGQSLFEWRNHPHVRRYSHHSEPIAWADHCLWFEKVLADPNRVLLIGESSGQPVGVLRYDMQDSEALVSVYLDPSRLGQGYGTALLQSGLAWLSANAPQIRTALAEIHTDNPASVRAFEKAGYRKKTVKQDALLYEYRF
jgi:UDP-2,4-diacetamido-2,4,6-trideoxy-beta-L-altropyranose hydrolase